MDKDAGAVGVPAGGLGIFIWEKVFLIAAGADGGAGIVFRNDRGPVGTGINSPELELTYGNLLNGDTVGFGLCVGTGVGAVVAITVVDGVVEDTVDVSTFSRAGNRAAFGEDTDVASTPFMGLHPFTTGKDTFGSTTSCFA